MFEGIRECLKGERWGVESLDVFKERALKSGKWEDDEGLKEVMARVK